MFAAAVFKWHVQLLCVSLCNARSVTLTLVCWHCGGFDSDTRPREMHCIACLHQLNLCTPVDYGPFPFMRCPVPPALDQQVARRLRDNRQHQHHDGPRGHTLTEVEDVMGATNSSKLLLLFQATITSIAQVISERQIDATIPCNPALVPLQALPPARLAVAPLKALPPASAACLLVSACACSAAAAAAASTAATHPAR